MITAPSTQAPALAPPGAGIPAIERWVGGAIFAWRRWRGSPAVFTGQFQQQQREIDALCRGRDRQVLGQRVLILRLRGLEDSSRWWSVWMTLDHLRIVNEQIAGVIGELLDGRVPQVPASTAAVKPRADAGPEALLAHAAAGERLLGVVAARPDHSLRTRVRYAHPWFGPLDAAGWHAMAAMHMGIHRAQIARILLESDRAAS